MSQLREMLIRHEGIRLRPYLCSAGRLTIGVGRNLEDVGISEGEALLLLDHDIENTSREVREAFHWFASLTPARQDVVISMVFNLGLNRFKEFKLLVGAIERGDWKEASREMLLSKWAKQVKGRSVELSALMLSGERLSA